MISGYATRLLADYKLLEGEALVRVFHFAMSAGAACPIKQLPGWKDFLKGSGTILLIDNDLWNLVNNWVSTLDEETLYKSITTVAQNVCRLFFPERKSWARK